jgi:undecaprenyl-diphosphatase
MELWHAFILGLVEGITEYLPVSSTGHLILTERALGLSGEENKHARDAYLVVIQAGAILAVVGLYWPRFVQMLRGLVGRDPDGMRLLLNIAMAFVPAAVVGLLLNKWIKFYLFHPAPVAGALVLGGIYMLLVDRWKARQSGPGLEIEDLTPGRALIIGLFQCGALWPGTSRSMMTITGGYIVGLRPIAAAEFSFLLGVPVLFAAAGLDLVQDYTRSRSTGEPMFWEVLGPLPTAVGVVTAALAAAAAVRFLIAFLGKRGLSPFGWYRIIIGVVFLTLAFSGQISVG